ncbi:hypothetical protein DESPIG_01470 [Desulfovibrio piger ATCC 29098]|uniref:Uncharacterized protein n=1 Tax=Desulfovibrio piger ATCC 29098 TaxID=411464 RepID=B6WTR3_9BACT|nr:hypothetical protein DESPIG_01470 [Desulfovibrio piger ATCC 29098]
MPADTGAAGQGLRSPAEREPSLQVPFPQPLKRAPASFQEKDTSRSPASPCKHEKGRHTITDVPAFCFMDTRTFP